MPSQAIKYRFKDGDRLDAAALNSRVLDIDVRLVTLEGLQMSWETAVTAVQNQGVTRLNDAVLPLVEQVREGAETVRDILEAVGDVVTQPELDAALAEPTAVLIARTDGLITGMTEQVAGATRTTTINRTAGQISSVVTEHAGQRRTVTYTRNETGLITGYTAVEEIL